MKSTYLIILTLSFFVVGCNEKRDSQVLSLINDFYSSDSVSSDFESKLLKGLNESPEEATKILTQKISEKEYDKSIYLLSHLRPKQLNPKSILPAIYAKDYLTSYKAVYLLRTCKDVDSSLSEKAKNRLFELGSFVYIDRVHDVPMEYGLHTCEFIEALIGKGVKFDEANCFSTASKLYQKFGSIGLVEPKKVDALTSVTYLKNSHIEILQKPRETSELLKR